jgi:hypothetical protein
MWAQFSGANALLFNELNILPLQERASGNIGEDVHDVICLYEHVTYVSYKNAGRFRSKLGGKLP